MTLNAVITPMTEKTPMVTPSIVRIERSLFVFSAISAMRKISWKFIDPHPALRATLSPLRGARGLARDPSPACGRGCREAAGEGVSFVPPGLDRIQPRRRQNPRADR